MEIFIEAGKLDCDGEDNIKYAGSVSSLDELASSLSDVWGYPILRVHTVRYGRKYPMSEDALTALRSLYRSII